MSKLLIDTIRNVPDFPKKGIMFRDITTLLKDQNAFKEVTDNLYEQFRSKEIDKVVSVESRGFIFGAPLAYALGVGFVPIRKPRKLPAATIREEYTLEYGSDVLEIHKDAITPGERVVLVDDLLATGGTMGAAIKLVKALGGEIVSLAFLIELSFLKGREQLAGHEVFTLITYDSE